jgi:hypothetical protein
MRLASGVLILIAFARPLSACECASEMVRARAAVSSQDEGDVTAAVLHAYFSALHGEGSRDRIALYLTTIKPSPSQLEVHVFSPANDDPSRQYSSRGVKKLREDLMSRSAVLVELRSPSPHYMPAFLRASDCKTQLRSTMFADAVAVSRPGFDGREKALLYLEYLGGARAYHLIREGARWTIDWYVELWQCG